MSRPPASDGAQGLSQGFQVRFGERLHQALPGLLLQVRPLLLDALQQACHPPLGVLLHQGRHQAAGQPLAGSGLTTRSSDLGLTAVPREQGRGQRSRPRVLCGSRQCLSGGVGQRLPGAPALLELVDPFPGAIHRLERVLGTGGDAELAAQARPGVHCQDQELPGSLLLPLRLPEERPGDDRLEEIDHARAWRRRPRRSRGAPPRRGSDAPRPSPTPPGRSPRRERRTRSWEALRPGEWRGACARGAARRRLVPRCRRSRWRR